MDFATLTNAVDLTNNTLVVTNQFNTSEKPITTTPTTIAQIDGWQTMFVNFSNKTVLWYNVALAIVLVVLMLSTAIGNLFVIVAILIEKNLRTIGNYLVLSLAIADLMVSLLVMPLAGIYQLRNKWTLGLFLCDIWTSADVFCCTGKRKKRKSLV